MCIQKRLSRVSNDVIKDAVSNGHLQMSLFACNALIDRLQKLHTLTHYMINRPLLQRCRRAAGISIPNTYNIQHIVSQDTAGLYTNHPMYSMQCGHT